MLGHPQAAVAPGFGMGGEVARVLEGAAGIGLFGDAGELEDRQYRHGRESPTATPLPAQAAAPRPRWNRFRGRAFPGDRYAGRSRGVAAMRDMAEVVE